MDFYYDRLMDSDTVTYRLWGQKLKSGVESLWDNGGNISTANELLDEPECILRDVIREPLSLSVSHQYDYETGLLHNLNSIKDKWGEFWDQLKQRYSQSVASLSNIAQQFTSDSTSSIMTSVSNSWQFINASDFFKTFQGTRIDLTLNFRSRLYGRKRNGKYETPLEMLQFINQYFTGDTLKDDSISYVTYTPPHGYLAQVNQKWNPSGTLTLFYGKSLVISSLLLKDFSFTFSREMREDRSPLYIDLSFSLIPAILWTGADIDNMITGYADSTVDSSDEDRAKNIAGWTS